MLPFLRGAGLKTGPDASSGGGGSGGSGTLDTQTVTTGASGTAISNDRKRGYISGSLGSISDGTSNVYSGAAVNKLYWDENGGDVSDFVSMEIAGAQANSGWSSITIGGTHTFNRADAAFSASGNTTWTWQDLGYFIGSQPFGASGAIKNVAFN